MDALRRRRNPMVLSRIPRPVVVTAAVLAAVPFGWMVGLFAAYLVAGPNFGQLPIMTVPLGITAAIVFALVPAWSAWTRLAIMVVGTGVLVALSAILVQ
jgi:hypothetical protein